MAGATLDYSDSMMADAWRCSECDGLTFDASDFEVPKYCCRCGAEFVVVDCQRGNNA